MKKKYLISYLCVFYSFCYLTIASNSNDNPEYFLFIGNPGVGKSTLINSLIGENRAQSGVNSALGLTQFFTAYEHNGKYYVDTPGLADIEMRENAALEIEKALKQNGTYRIFFIITLQAGRVRPEDVTTINIVMAAIENQNKNFNVIINNVTRKERRDILFNPTKMAILYQAINSGTHTTNSIFYIDNDREMDDGDKEFITINDELRDFIYQDSLSIFIAQENVSTIEIDEYEKIKEEYEKEITHLNEQINLSNQQYNELLIKWEVLKRSQPKKKKKRWYKFILDIGGLFW